MLSSAGLLVAAVSLLCATVTSSTLTPPVLPLIVRNPYLSTWLGDARISPWNKWPMFWTGQEMGLGMLAAVPDSGQVYPLLGRPHDSLLPKGHSDGYNLSFCSYLGATFDASTTNLTYLIPAPSSSSSQSPLELVISFLSPITPTSTLRQSIPASYITVHVSGDFEVDVYIDINGQWVSGDRGSKIEWRLDEKELAEGKGMKTWSVRRRNEYLLSEIRDRAEWGRVHLTAPLDVRHEAGTSGLLRPRFARTGTLQNTMDRDFRSIMDEEPVFAFAKSFKLNASHSGTTKDSVLFTLAHTQDPVVQYASARGLTMMRPLWASWFASVPALLEFHFLDFSNAAKLAANYSQQLEIDADKSGSQQYVDYVALTARQVIGATSFSGTPDNPILFLKEISSNGNFQTIDVIFPAFPFFLYTNPKWLVYLLEPILEHTLSGQYPNKYALHDLGAHFPNATGHPDGRDEYMPVEECGNILIMGLAVVNSLLYETGIKTDPSLIEGSFTLGEGDDSSGKGIFPLKISTRDTISHLDETPKGSAKGLKQARKWIGRSYRLWKQWTAYLVEFSLRPENQLSTDDFAGPLQLQTNLALKGIIGIRAMSEIAATVDNTGDYEYYKNISETYIAKWQEYGISRDGTHAKLSYDWFGSWTTLYNLYADALLCFHLDPSASSHTKVTDPDQPLLVSSPSTASNGTGFVPREIYHKQSQWYHNVLQRYGLPLDSRHLYTKSDWSFFAAAVTSRRTRMAMLTASAKWLNETSTDRPLTDLYNTEDDGGFLGAYFMARPVVGGHFAFLTLGQACGGQASEGLAFLDDEETYPERELDESVIAGARQPRPDTSTPWAPAEDVTMVDEVMEEL